MKTLLTIVSLAALAGCAYAPPAPPAYQSGYLAPADPGQWRVVSVTPVAPGTGERLAASSGNGSAVQYSSTPVTAAPLYVSPPVYVAAPLYYAPAYAPAPYAPYAPYYYPPVSIGLDFMFGRSWGNHGRNWGGVGIGSRWHR